MATIGIIGAGAVGSYYGALLVRAGHDVRFLLRRDLEAVRARGLDVRSKDGDFHLARVNAAAHPGDIGVCDWVVCSLKATALEDAHRLISPCLGPETRIVALMNGLGIEERLGGWFGRERVLGAMAFVCLNRGAPGVVHHLDYGRVTIGSLSGDAATLAELQVLLGGAGVDVIAAPSLLTARWEKLCWNIPFNGLSVAAGGVSTRVILDDRGLRATAERAMREVVAAANADITDHQEAGFIDAGDMVKRMFNQTETMGHYRTSMVIDSVLGRPLEVDAILGEPLRRAEVLGVPAPTMATIHALVSARDRAIRGAIRVLGPGDVGPERVD